jgi:aldose 1-epimerase
LSDGRKILLPINNGQHHLHGGPDGFYKQIWQLASIYHDTNDSGTAPRANVVFRHVSPDGAGGYPGEVTATVTYSLDGDNTLRMKFEATTTAETIVNLCNHAYWNLSGARPSILDGPGATSPSVLGHRLWINAEHVTEVDGELIPTGRLTPVRSTPGLDFTRPTGTPLSVRIGQWADCKSTNGGVDHNFVLNRPRDSGGRLVHAATLSDPSSGRVMDVSTTAVGIQCYTGNFLAGAWAGRGGVRYGKHAAVCLETQVRRGRRLHLPSLPTARLMGLRCVRVRAVSPQAFPDSPNIASFPSVTLMPGERYVHETAHHFSVAEGRSV